MTVYVVSKRNLGSSGWWPGKAFVSFAAAKLHVEALLGTHLMGGVRWSELSGYADLFLNSDLVNFAVARISFLTVEG